MSFTDILTTVLTEISLRESCIYVIKDSTLLETKLSVGGQLLAFLTEQGQMIEVSKLRHELWICLKSELSPSSVESVPI